MGHFLAPSIVYEYIKLANERGTKSFLKGVYSQEPPCIYPWPFLAFIVLELSTVIEKDVPFLNGLPTKDHLFNAYEVIAQSL
jgi:hypothetical protein